MARKTIRELMTERYEQRIRRIAGVSSGASWERAQAAIARLDPAERSRIAAECWAWHDEQIAALDEAALKRGISV